MKRLVAFAFMMGSLGAYSDARAIEPCKAESGMMLSGTKDAPWDVKVELNHKDIPLNTPFDAAITICSRQNDPPQRIDVDATMPAHKHGMNYEPKTARIDSHRHEVKNLVFHMPGIWRLEVTAYQGDKPHRFTQDVRVR